MQSTCCKRPLQDRAGMVSTLEEIDGVNVADGFALFYKLGGSQSIVAATLPNGASCAAMQTCSPWRFCRGLYHPQTHTACSERLETSSSCFRSLIPRAASYLDVRKTPQPCLYSVLAVARLREAQIEGGAEEGTATDG